MATKKEFGLSERGEYEQGYKIYSEDLANPIRIRSVRGVVDLSSSTNFNGIRNRIMEGEDMKNWVLMEVFVAHRHVNLIFKRKDGRKGEGYIGVFLGCTFGRNKDVVLGFELQKEGGLLDYFEVSSARELIADGCPGSPIRSWDNGYDYYFSHIFEKLDGGETLRWLRLFFSDQPGWYDRAFNYRLVEHFM